jgi:type 1 glutamine amidotransferase
MYRRAVRTTLLVAALAVALVAATMPAAVAEAPEVIDLLVLTETAGFRHSSIGPGAQMLEDLAENEQLSSVDFTVTTLANSMGEGPAPGAPTVNLFVTSVNPSHQIANVVGPSVFTDEGLAGYDVVVFVSTTGDFLTADEQAAFERFIQRGGGYVGIHAAADAEYEWPWYRDLVGGSFRGHPAIQEAAVAIEDATHASTAHLPSRWTRSDEWYSYQQNPRDYPCHTGGGQCGVHVLASLDETSYAVGNLAMGDHPITWCNEWDGGRAWYTGLGHTDASYTEPAFVQSVLGGLLTAADVEGLEDASDFAGTGVSFACEPASPQE